MTFMGSPIDARLSPTVTNKLAEERPFAWFESNMIYTVPAALSGHGPARLSGLRAARQLHVDEPGEAPGGAPRATSPHLMDGDGDSADKHLEFYDEYLSVLDLTEEFYLQTIDVVFQRYLLPKGELLPPRPPGAARADHRHRPDDRRGRERRHLRHRPDPGRPRPLPRACPPELKEDYVQPHVGHYGVFNGQRFREEIYPRVRDFIRRMEPMAQARPKRSADVVPIRQAAKV